MPADIPLDRTVTNATATVILFLLMGTAAVGIGEKAHGWEWTTQTSTPFLGLRIGGVGIEFMFGPAKPHPPGGQNAYRRTDGLSILGFKLGSASYEWRNAAVTWWDIEIGLPWWAMLAYFLARPTYRLLRRVDEHQIGLQIARAKRELTHCSGCGYDLRESPDRCPECGKLTPTGVAKSRCAVCGYDLRATPDKCPECGTVPKETR